MAAPALAASMLDCAICAGVTGTAGFFPGESADPVTAHEIITLRCMAVILPCERVILLHKRVLARLQRIGTLAERGSQATVGQLRWASHRPSSARLASHCALR